MTNLVDIRPDHLRIVQDVLRDHLPAGVEVWVFGSRAQWSAREASDLDLALEGETEIDRRVIEALADALEDSDLPYTVDVVDINRISKRFRQIVNAQRVPLTGHIQPNLKERGQYLATGNGSLYHPHFPEHWERRPLYSLAQWVNGLAFRNIQFSPSGRPIIKIAEIKGGISDQTKFTQQAFDESVRVRSGDLLFAWSGQPETSIDAHRWSGPEGWLNQHIFRVTPGSDVDPSFFYYLLKYLKQNFVDIARNKQTTGLGHVTKRDLENIEAAIPAIEEQRAIAGVLGAPDNKIELNRRMNGTLEEMARALFKSWFVDFDPVRAKIKGHWRRGESLPGLPSEMYDLFPARLVESELGVIPEGWEVEPLGDLIDLAYGKALKAGNRKAGNIPVYGSNGQVGWHDKQLVAGPGVVVGRKGNPGTITWTSSDFYPIDTAFYVIPKNEKLGLHFLFYALAEQNLSTIAADSAVPGLNRNLAYMNRQLVPDKTVTNIFCDYSDSILSRRHLLYKHSHTLEAQRDVLLPMLISGQLGKVDSS